MKNMEVQRRSSRIAEAAGFHDNIHLIENSMETITANHELVGYEETTEEDNTFEPSTEGTSTDEGTETEIDELEDEQQEPRIFY